MQTDLLTNESLQESFLLDGGVIRRLFKGVESAGFNPELIFKQSNIPVQCYRDNNWQVNGVDFFRLVSAAQQTVDDVMMGMVEQPFKAMAEALHLKEGFKSATLGGAIRTSTQLRTQLRNDVNYDYTNDDDNHAFVFGVNNYSLKPNSDPAVFYWFKLLSIYRYYSWLIGKRIKLRYVAFTAKENELDLDAQALFRCEVRYDQPFNGLCFDKNVLSAPLVRTEAELMHGDMVKNFPNFFEIPGYDHSWSRQVEEILLRLQQEGIANPHLDEVSSIASVSSRTLRRQLTWENDTFQDIKDRVRRDIAIKLLMTTDTPVTQVACQLGFAEPGNFTRAFIKWTGKTPTDFRSANKGDTSLMGMPVEQYRSHHQKNFPL